MGGKVYIPAFSLGRSQELIYEMDRLFSDSELRAKFPELGGEKVPVFLDSPLGLKITEIYSKLGQYWDQESRGLLTVGDHLKEGIGERCNDILFVGYQAKGTPGRDILKYHRRPGSYVYLDDRKYDIRARVHQLSGYSAHADCDDLVAWVSAMAEKPGRIKLVHGDPEAQKALAGKLVDIRLCCRKAGDIIPVYFFCNSLSALSPPLTRNLLEFFSSVKLADQIDF